MSKSDAQIGPPLNPVYPMLWVESMDYQNNIAAKDSAWTNGHPSVEMFEDGLTAAWKVNYIVYKKGDTIRGTSRIQNRGFDDIAYTTTNVPGIMVSPSNPSPFQPPFQTIPLTATITSGGSGFIAQGEYADISWTIQGVPDYLCAGDISQAVNLEIVTLTSQEYFTNPTPLMDVYLSRMVATPIDTMSVPWADFAYHVGLWGWGADSPQEAKHNLTYGIHYSNRHPWNRLIYDSSEPKFFDLDFPIFNMTTLLNQIGTQPIVSGDCQDFASILSYAFECNGLATQLRRAQAVQWWDGQRFTGSFTTNPLCPAGSDSTLYQPGFYQTYPFNFHMVAYLEYLVYDCPASHKYDPSGALHLNPIVGMIVSTYWQSFPYGLCAFPNPATLDSSVWGSDRQHPYLI